MRVAVTGHNWGFGKHIFNVFNNDENYEVVGFDESNGFDISNTKTVKKLTKKSDEFDILINNAYAENGNRGRLLRNFIQKWTSTYKQIVNINSGIVYLPKDHPFFDMTGPSIDYNFQNNCLKELEITRNEIIEGNSQPVVLQHTPRVMQVMFGLADLGHPDYDHLCFDKMDPRDGAEYIKFMVDNIEKYHAKEVFLDRVQKTPL